MVVTVLVTMCVAGSPAIGYPSGVLEKPAYVRALTGLLENAPSWTREILKRNGPYVSSVRTTEDSAGIAHERFNMCVPKPKCDDTTIILIFAPNGAQAWAGLREKGVVSFLGSPSEAQQAVLKRQLSYSDPPPKVTTPYLFDVLKKKTYARSSKSLVDHAGKLPDWTRDLLTGNEVTCNSSPAELADIQGITYEVFSVCVKEFSCTDTRVIVMFAPNGAEAWGVVVHEGATYYLGAPSDAQLVVMRAALGEMTPNGDPLVVIDAARAWRMTTIEKGASHSGLIAPAT